MSACKYALGGWKAVSNNAKMPGTGGLLNPLEAPLSHYYQRRRAVFLSAGPKPTPCIYVTGKQCFQAWFLVERIVLRRPLRGDKSCATEIKTNKNIWNMEILCQIDVSKSV